MGKKVGASTNKLKNRRSIKMLLIPLLVLSIVVPLSILGFTSSFKAQDILKENLKVTTSQTISEINLGMTTYLEGIECQLDSLALMDEVKYYDKNTLDEAKLKKVIGAIVDSNPSIGTAYFGTSDKDMYIYPEQSLPTDYDPTSRPWYSAAVDGKSSDVWSEPYKDASSGEYTITVAKTVIQNGRTIGVVGVDVSLKILSDTFVGHKIGQSGYLFITDEKGVTLVHPKESVIGTDAATKLEFWNEASSENNGFTEYDYDGKTKLLSFDTNEITGWKIFGSMEMIELTSDTDVISYFTYGGILVGAILAICISLIISRIITVPLQKLESAFGKASSGDLTVTANVNRNDEFGQISEDFNNMIKNISGLFKEVRISADTVQQTAINVNDISNQASRATEEVARTIEEIAKGANEQAKDAEQGTFVVNDLSEVIDKVVKTSEEMSDMSGKASELSKVGLNRVDVLIEKSVESNKANRNVSDIVNEMNLSADRIGIITETIAQIAEQTNLLALNAAIEAARAGEQGKGFAVVADEVRKLAEQSGNASMDIRELIVSIQKQIHTAVDSMVETKKIFEDQDVAVDETKNIFEQIATSIDDLTTKTGQIQLFAADMNVSKNEMVSMIGNVSAASEETSAATQEVSASTEEQLASVEEVSSHTNELSELAQKLKEAINAFKVQ